MQVFFVCASGPSCSSELFCEDAEIHSLSKRFGYGWDYGFRMVHQFGEVALDIGALRSECRMSLPLKCCSLCWHSSNFAQVDNLLNDDGSE